MAKPSVIIRRRFSWTNADAHNNLGVAFLRNGQRDEAVAHLREALRLNPEYEEVRKQLRELGVTAAQ